MNFQKMQKHTQKWILIGLLCIIWYLVSIGKALLAKYVSTLFKRPLTLSFGQLVSISVYSIPLLYFCKLKFRCTTRYYFLRFVIPLSILKALTTATSHLAIWNISVSYSQIMRASLPVFTAIFCRVLLKTKLSTRLYLSLIPIVIGVFITSKTEYDFSLSGMVYGLIATSGSSLQNIYNKVLMERSKIHTFELMAILGWVSCFLFFFVWFSVDGLYFIQIENKFEFAPGWWKVPSLIIFDGFTNFIQNVVAFAVLYLISPTSYAVGNIAKRPLIIVISIYVFSNMVTYVNAIGIAITVFGASLYTYFEMDEDRKEAAKENQNVPSTGNLLQPEANQLEITEKTVKQT